MSNIDELQTEIAKFYVVVINAGEALKNAKITSQNKEQIKIYTQKYEEILSNILNTKPLFERIKTRLT